MWCHKINSTGYGISNNEHGDGRKSDVIYTAKDQKHSERTHPLLVEVQQKVDLTFIKRLTRYCLSIHDVYKVKPVVAVFIIQGFALKAFRDSTFTKEKDEPFYRCKQDLWSEACRFYSLDNISDQVLSEQKLKPIIALAYFLCSQQRSIIALEENDDKTFREIYSIAAKSFKKYNDVQLSQEDQYLEMAKNTNKQFSKTVACVEEYEKESKPVTLKRLKKYAEDGVNYTAKKLKKDAEDIVVTPIEQEKTSADLFFVVQQREKYKSMFKWTICYEKGPKQGLFQKYASALSLKNTYHNKRL